MCSITLNTGPLPLRLGPGDNTAGGLNTGRARVFDGSQRTRVTSGIARLPVLLFFLSRLLSGACSHEERS